MFTYFYDLSDLCILILQLIHKTGIIQEAAIVDHGKYKDGSHVNYRTC